MNDDQRVERIASALITGAAPSRAPGRLLDDTLTTLERTRQRPRWLAFIKEPPMRTPTGVVVGSPTVRRAAFLALTLTLLLGLTGAVAVGASLILRQSTELPPPFGPTANGVIAYDRDGDIWIADADGEHPRPIISDTADDTYPYFSPDGTRFVFTRTVAGEAPHVVVANADGTGVTRIADVPGSIDGWWWTDWSPDSASLLVLWMIDGQPTISILTADGSAPPRDLVLDGLLPVERPTWLPPDGAEIIFQADPATRLPTRGVYAVRPDGTGLRTLAVSGDTACQFCPYQQPVVSPDGRQMVFWNWEDNEAGITGTYLHLLDLETLTDRALTLDPAQEGVGFAPRFSPDGESLLFEVAGAREGDAQLVLAPIDGREPARAVGAAYPNDLAGADFSPDGSTVVLDRGSAGTWLIDIASGEAMEFGDAVTGSSWQRLAP